jgi:hypothetical protein
LISQNDNYIEFIQPFRNDWDDVDITPLTGRNHQVHQQQHHRTESEASESRSGYRFESEDANGVDEQFEAGDDNDLIGPEDQRNYNMDTVPNQVLGEVNRKRLTSHTVRIPTDNDWKQRGTGKNGNGELLRFLQERAAVQDLVQERFSQVLERLIDKI